MVGGLETGKMATRWEGQEDKTTVFHPWHYRHFEPDHLFCMYVLVVMVVVVGSCPMYLLDFVF